MKKIKVNSLNWEHICIDAVLDIDQKIWHWEDFLFNSVVWYNVDPLKCWWLVGILFTTI